VSFIVAFVGRIVVTPEQLLGRYLRDLRLNRDWSIDDLVRISGLSRTYLYYLESGRYKSPLGTLAKLAAVFGMPLCELLEASGYCRHLEKSFRELRDELAHFSEILDDNPINKIK